MLSKQVTFQKAQPVWVKDLSEQMNIELLFCTEIIGDSAALLRISASNPYQVFLNRQLILYGPARAGHGYFRVDELDVSPYLTNQGNRLEIYTVAYGVNNYSQVKSAPFLAAEIVQNGRVMAATLPQKSQFQCYRYTPRIQKVQRYSYQRPFAEAYDLHRGAYRTAPLCLCAADQEQRVFLERGVDYPLLEKEPAQAILCHGRVGILDQPPRYEHSFITGISQDLQGFPADELDRCTIWDAQALDFTVTDGKTTPGNQTVLSENSFAVLDMGRNFGGFSGMTVTCHSDITLYFLFDEIIRDNDPNQIDFTRLDVSAVVVWELPAGRHSLLTFEPSVYRYARVVCLGGGCEIEDVHLRRVGSALPPVKLRSEDPVLQAVFDAAIETYRTNTLDIYMDCASRERAGWLCDSFFTARSERTLTGQSKIERNFLENFILPKAFPHLPEGMLPMCYPADHYTGTFIPNWAMWYVLELEEYLARTGDRELVDAAKERLENLLAFFRQYENCDGLLENLPSWVFVEWSKANEFVQPINFPSNMLYARMKQAMASLYHNPDLQQEADRLMAVIRKRSFDGEFFHDRILYDSQGNQRLTDDISEACQYYAFFTGVATPESHPVLWNTLLTQFGPHRKQTGAYPQVWPANSFVGNYLRLELLLTHGYFQELLENIKDYLYYMAQRTGSLWENDGAYASCSHGFASHLVVWLERLGLLER